CWGNCAAGGCCWCSITWKSCWKKARCWGGCAQALKRMDTCCGRCKKTEHQSFLLLTSREKPAALRALEGSRTLVRSLRISGLEAIACEQLLAEHEVTGSPEEQDRLGEIYVG